MTNKIVLNMFKDIDLKSYKNKGETEIEGKKFYIFDVHMGYEIPVLVVKTLEQKLLEN